MQRRTSAILMGMLVGLAAAWTPPCPARTLWVDGSATAPTEDGSAGAPFRTIGAAMKAVAPGDTVTIRAGTYREEVRIPSGEPGKPITVQAAEGERVIVTGCRQLEGWTRLDGRLWTTVLDWKPEQLLVGAKRQPIARRPSEGWWRSVHAGDGRLTDPKNLRGLEAASSGGEIRVWLQRGNIYRTYPLAALDTETGVATLAGEGRELLRDGDLYYLQNRAEFIERPGQWAVEPEGAKFKVFFWPPKEDDLQRVEAPALARSVVVVRNASHLRIEGLEVTGSRRYGIEIHGAEDVVVRRCVVHHNGQNGISLREVKNGLVKQNLAWRNGNGIAVGFSQRVTVEENDCGYNEIDGLLVTWKSDEITVRRNCSHHHLLWGHPDNVQLYRGVTRTRFVENLLLAGGQSVMMEETQDGQFTGNMIVGSMANMLIFGHQNAGHYQILGNTLAFSGYGVMSLTWEDYDVRENVFVTGHGGALFGVRGVRGYTADRNLFWNSARAERPTVLATDTGWHRDFDVARASTGEDARSVYADPQFRNAPVAFTVLDHRRLEECTCQRWYLRNGTRMFRVGDYVEVNFDGRRHRVTGLDEASITVAPGLKERPIKDWLVANWGDNPDFRLDLRLRPSSPGARLSSAGGPVGSPIDIQAFLQGDFDGDGRRDLPELPAELMDE